MTELNLFSPPPTYYETQIETQERRIEQTTDKYKMMRCQTIALALSITTNCLLAFLLGLILIDPYYNQQWIKRMRD